VRDDWTKRLSYDRLLFCGTAAAAADAETDEKSCGTSEEKGRNDYRWYYSLSDVPWRSQSGLAMQAYSAASHLLHLGAKLPKLPQSTSASNHSSSPTHHHRSALFQRHTLSGLPSQCYEILRKPPALYADTGAGTYQVERSKGPTSTEVSEQAVNMGTCTDAVVRQRPYGCKVDHVDPVGQVHTVQDE